MAFCKFLSVYLFNGPGIEAGAEVKVRTEAKAWVSVNISVKIGV